MNRSLNAVHIPAGFLRGVSLFIAGVTICLFQNCNKVNFKSAPIADGSTVSGQGIISGGGHCNLVTLTVPVKILFVVDTSGSNATASTDRGTQLCDSPTQPNCSPPTDPNKTFRSGSITAFFDKYESKSNFSWGLDVFSQDTAGSYINGGGFSNSQDMSTAISEFDNASDGGDTPYLAALAAAKNAIKNDPDLNSTAAHPPLYNIIFLSDGYPTDALNTDGSVDMSQVNAAIGEILALSPSRISLNTAYYGTIDDPVAANTLQSMATTGGGQFVNVDTSSTSSISISDLITIPQGQCL